MEDDYYEDDDSLDAEDEWEFDCGMTYDSRGRVEGCSMVGSEDCDFECPNRDEMFRILDRRRAKRAEKK